ncbi:hypothetical protein RIF29_30070 [Crotalaria pallida]|uniref:Uncharacterized protein n=1 Tax=Crotalaria pallida TaxID=3830 RepID=A0AAN9I0Z4_CROPI
MIIKVAGKSSGDNKGASRTSNPNFEAKKNKQLDSPNGSRYEALNYSEDKTEEKSDVGPPIRPHAAAGKAQFGSNLRTKKFDAVQAFGSSKPVVSKNNGEVNWKKQFETGPNSVAAPSIDAEKEKVIEREARVRRDQKEKEILRVMSRKQNEMWDDFKQGKNVDDFLGCVGVHMQQKELEFFKHHSVKEKDVVQLPNPSACHHDGWPSHEEASMRFTASVNRNPNKGGDSANSLNVS